MVAQAALPAAQEPAGQIQSLVLSLLREAAVAEEAQLLAQMD
jgi:hypothetical protein